ncbi:MBG domain-containing protein [Marinoscillum furvescens]|nr:MBG domain-containing protein [Marinoscillum furvescens]
MKIKHMMKKTSLFILAILCVQVVLIAQSSDTLLWLKNNHGIIEDGNGAVTRWENAVGSGDAVQPDPSLAGEQMQETYPGKVNVGFSKNGSHMTIEGSNAYTADNTFSVFYVGKTGDVGSVAVMFGNFRVENNNWGTCSGVRFTRKGNGDMTIQYGRPTYKQIVLNNLPENAFFFFGFSLDASGNYKYFDNTSSIIKTGTLDGTIHQNDDDHLINLARQGDGNYTYFHTEMAELMMFGEPFSTSEMEQAHARLAADYPEVIRSDFEVTEVFPTDRTHLGVSESIRMTFNQNVDFNSTLPKVYINKSTTEAPGSWTLTASNELTYTPGENWPHGALVTIELDENLKSTDGVGLGVAKRSEYNLIVSSATTFGVDTVVLSPMATVDYPQAGHKLPMYLVVPEDRTEKVPVHIWVHGGGWSGGSLASSVASYSPHGTYLAENLGVATLGISYRCKGSNGTFTLAMEDIDAAYQWAVANAATYNFDMSKVFFSGGSAGSPLAALAAQRYDGTVGFIGFNGIYDFVNDSGSWGQGNGYGQEDPSAEANSAIFQLSDTPPPAIMMHGDADNTIPHTQSVLFADAINNQGGIAETVIYPGEVHAFFNLNQQEYQDVLYEMARFMTGVLDGTIQAPEPRVARAYVSPTGDDASGDGTEASPYATLSKAYAEAVAGDTIFIKAGTYTYTGKGSLLNVTKTITLIGEGADVTILQNGTQPVYESKTTQGRFALLTTANQSLTMEGITVRHCGWYGSNIGGGIVNITQSAGGESTFTARRCRFERSVTRYGGVVQVTGSGANKVIFEDCSFTNNYAMPQITNGAYPQRGNYSGGVIHASNNGSFEVYNCVFYNNGTLDNPLDLAEPGNTTNGRVINANNGQPGAYGIITNSTFIDNVATGAPSATVAPAIKHLAPASSFKFINNLLVDNVAEGNTGGVDMLVTATQSSFFDYFKSNLIGKLTLDESITLDASNAVDPAYTKGAAEVLVDGGATPNIVVNSYGVETVSATGSLVLGTGQTGTTIKLHDINGNARGINVDLGAVQSSEATASLELADLSQTYDGTPRAVAVTTYPEGLGMVISYDGASEAPIAAGSYGVTATVAASDPDFGGESTSGTLVIHKAAQEIDFPELETQNRIAHATFELGATGGGSGNALTYTSSNTDVASISGNTVTLHAAGEVTITASQAGSANYEAAAPVERLLTVVEQYEWDGSSWNSQSAPSPNKDVVFSGDWTSSESLEARSVEIRQGATVTVSAGTALTINEAITNDGALIVQSGGALLTFGSVSGENYQIERTTTFGATTGKYSMVGSPVQSAAFDVLGTNVIVYGYDESEPYEAGQTEGLKRFKSPQELSVASMEAGRGYFSSFTGDANGKVVFSGVPNSGEVNVTLAYTDQGVADEAVYQGFNLVANPYPAAISFEAFMSANSEAAISGSIYIWDDYSSDEQRGLNSDYLVVNALGNTDSRAGGDAKWDGMIRSCQGFFVKATGPTSIVFTDSMLQPTHNGDDGFYRGSETTYKLLLSNESASVATIVGYAAGATEGLDDAYDAPVLGSGGFRFYSLLGQENHRLAIQGLPESHRSEVALGYRVDAAGAYTLSLASTSEEPLTSGVMLHDKATGAFVAIAEETYTFTSSQGTFEDRFALLTAGVLGVEETEVPRALYVAGKSLYYDFGVLEDQHIHVYDISGHLLFSVSGLAGKGQYDLNHLPDGVYVLHTGRYRQKVRVAD